MWLISGLIKNNYLSPTDKIDSTYYGQFFVPPPRGPLIIMQKPYAFPPMTTLTYDDILGFMSLFDLHPNV